MGPRLKSSATSPVRRGRTTWLLAAVALATVGCTDDSGIADLTSTPALASTTVAETTTTLADTTTTEPTDSDTTGPEETSTSTTEPPAPGVDLPPPLENDDGTQDHLSGVGRLTGQGSDCTAFLVDTGTADGPAFALTNGHCVGLFDSHTVVIDGPGGGTVAFNRFVDTDDVEVGVATVRWATMRGVDLAVLELDTTLGDLREQDIAAYALGPPPLEDTGIRIVGVPVTGVDPDEYFLRASDCAAGTTSRLLEFTWLWDAAQSNDCDAIVGGNSGSPVFDPDGVVVGIINTTTVAASPGGECYLGHPCELTADGARMVADTSYAIPVDGVAACFTAAGTFDVSTCELEPATPPVTVAISAPAQQSPASWRLSIERAAGAQPVLAGKSGPIGQVDCRDPAGYQQIDPAAFQPPAPSGEGFSVACVAPLDGATVATGTASYAILQVDDTPPVVEPELSVIEGEDGGYSIEPIFATPELSDYLVKVGPPATTDCADPDGYVRYRRIPIQVPAAAVPASVCVIGHDLADNAAPPARFELG